MSIRDLALPSLNYRTPLCSNGPDSLPEFVHVAEPVSFVSYTGPLSLNLVAKIIIFIYNKYMYIHSFSGNMPFLRKFNLVSPYPQGLETSCGRH